MSFQFQCPHCRQVLEGDESQASHACQCPTCHQPFIIPPPLTHPAPAPTPPAPTPPALAASPERIDRTGPTTRPVPPHDSFPTIDPGADAGEQARRGPRVFHIPCPHCPEHNLLETPEDMLGQSASCPYCGGQLLLRRKDSIEFQRDKAVELDRRDRRAGKKWFHLVIVLAVLVALGVALLLLFSTPG